MSFRHLRVVYSVVDTATAPTRTEWFTASGRPLRRLPEAIVDVFCLPAGHPAPAGWSGS